MFSVFIRVFLAILLAILLTGLTEVLSSLTSSPFHLLSVSSGQPDVRRGRRYDADREHQAAVGDPGTAVGHRGERGEGAALPHRVHGTRRHREGAHGAGGRIRAGRARQGGWWWWEGINVWRKRNRCVEQEMCGGSVEEVMCGGSVEEVMCEGSVEEEMCGGSVEEVMCEGSVEEEMCGGSVEEGSVEEEMCGGSDVWRKF